PDSHPVGWGREWGDLRRLEISIPTRFVGYRGRVPTMTESPITESTAIRAEDVLESLSRVIDPAFGINIHDLGLIFGIEVNHGVATIQMTLTSPESPSRGTIDADIHEVLKKR